MNHGDKAGENENTEADQMLRELICKALSLQFTRESTNFLFFTRNSLFIDSAAPIKCVPVFDKTGLNLKARSHGAIFSECDFDFLLHAMDCVDVYEGVHMVRFHVRAMHWCVWCRTWMGSIPILCDCDVQFQWMWCAFQCKYIGNRIHQCIAPCEQNH